MRGHRRTALVVAAIAALAVWGCSNPLNEADSISQDFVQAPQGMDLCYECHASDIFVEWVQSRHANFDYADAEAGRPDPLDAASFGGDYSTIVGDPGPSRFSRCAPCHTGWLLQARELNGSTLDTITDGALLSTARFGAVFTDPNLGEVARPVAACESCHMSGAGHLGAAQPPVVAVPALEECGECHGLVEDDHGVASYRVWLNDAGESPGPRNAPALTTEDFSGVAFSVWKLPAVSAWLGTPYAGPYLFQAERTILDTHFREIYLTEGDKVTIYTVPTAKFGYVDLTDTSPNSGMVRGDSEEACTASCHKPHDFDQAVNEQWFEGAHHPNLQGPLGTEDGELTVGGPANWGAVDHGGYSASCVRCHTSWGFAEVAPGYGSAVQPWAGSSDGFITCNACHDGVNYPTAQNKALRFTGTVALFNFDGQSPLDYVSAGTSAECVYCHQGREDSSRVAADLIAGKPRFRNMHYLPAGAMVYAAKGFEYPGLSYAGPHTHSLIESSCVACHMAEPDPPSEHLGGHTFHVAYGSTENTALCVDTCHPNMNAFDDPVDFAHAADWAGDGPATISAKDEVAVLLSTLLWAIETYDSADADTVPQVYYENANPYFYSTIPSQRWDAAGAKAAFNFQYVLKDPGAYAHNPKYAVQLLRDSYNNLRASAQNSGDFPALAGTRP